MTTATRPPHGPGRPRRRSVVCGLIAIVLCGVTFFGTLEAARQNAAPDTAEPDADETPREIGLIERARRRLAQIDMTLVGPPEVLNALTAENFKLKVNFKRIRELQLDRLCPIEDLRAELAAGKTDPSGASPTTPAVPLPLASYMFYFDQPYLTQEGRIRALDLARRMIPELLSGNSRIMIVSNGRNLEVFQPFTDDATPLLAALDRLENDIDHWMQYAEQEAVRIFEIVRILNEFNQVYRAAALARRYQREEAVLSDRNMRRLDVTLGQFIGLDVPKVAIYFADIMRENPGEHYLSFFSTNFQANDPTTASAGLSAYSAGSLFDKVVNQASANGIRVYTVHAQGLVGPLDQVQMTSYAATQSGQMTLSSRERMNDAQETLQSLSAETGGYAFLFGAPLDVIVERIRADSSCVFLLSFDPEGLPQDEALRVVVKLDRDDVEVRTRGRLVVQSESARMTSQLVQAFNEPGTLEDPVAVHAQLVPSGFENGTYRALLQLSMGGLPLNAATWDLGASVTAAHKVHDEVSGRVAVAGPGVPVVFESEIRFKPGDYEIVAVAHEVATDLIAAQELSVSWPAPKGDPFVLEPISLLQPQRGAFLRDGVSRRSGSVARGPGEAVRPDLAVALVGLVCSGRRREGTLAARRSLVGSSKVEFPELELQMGDDRCAQIRDLVPPGTLGAGRFVYEIEIWRDGEPVGKRSLEFSVAR